MKKYLFPADILLPDFDKYSAKAWATIACDQFTSEPKYWQEVTDFVGDCPSTLNIMLPEARLDRSDELIPKINATMKDYSERILESHPNSIIYVSRRLSGGKVRHGLVGMIDLEQYDYRKGSESLIRATEGTVLERIPPRVEIRRFATLELPHIMLLIDDPDMTVIEPLENLTANAEIAYDTELMLGGGHIVGKYVGAELQDRINQMLGRLASPEEQIKKYNNTGSPLLFAVGDGNHSLAAAKALYKEVKNRLGDAALSHPSRFALCEIVNIHDPANDFEPIYRMLFGTDTGDAVTAFEKYAAELNGDSEPQIITLLTKSGQVQVKVEHPKHSLAVETVQEFADAYISCHENVKVDYIHGIDSMNELISDNTLGFLFSGISKSSLFKAIIKNGVLPKKTFSIGAAKDKRYYMESRALAVD